MTDTTKTAVESKSHFFEREDFVGKSHRHFATLNHYLVASYDFTVLQPFYEKTCKLLT